MRPALQGIAGTLVVVSLLVSSRTPQPLQRDPYIPSLYPRYVAAGIVATVRPEIQPRPLTHPPPSSETKQSDLRLNASGPKQIIKIIIATARAFGIDVARFIAIARCESGLNPRAYNRTGCEGYGCYGLYQVHALYWASRARSAGVPNGDWRDPRVNARVAGYLVKHGGWGHWAACDPV